MNIYLNAEQSQPMKWKPATVQQRKSWVKSLSEDLISGISAVNPLLS